MYLGVRPSAELFLLGNSPQDQVLVVLEGARREAFGPLCATDRTALRRLARGAPVAADAPVTRWLLRTGFAEELPRLTNRPGQWQDRWSRQLSAYAIFAGIDGSEAVHEQVVSTHAIIIGLGGIGSNVVQHLVSIGVTGFTLVDADVVEVSNLNRQVIYRPEDVGAKKVVAAERFIRDRASTRPVDIQCVDVDFLLWEPRPSELPLGALAVVSADSQPIGIRRHASALFYPRRIPFGFVSYSGAQGKVGPLVFSSGEGCGSCELLRVQTDSSLAALVGPGLPRIPPSSSSTNSLLASVFIDRWLHSLAEESKAPTTVFIDMCSLSITTMQHARLWSCPVCGGAG